MKRGLMLLLILGLAGWAAAQDKEQGLMLPRMQHALRSGMSLSEIRAALPDPDKVAWELLANGTTLCYAEPGYSLLMKLYDGKLLDISVSGFKAKSPFGKWLASQVDSLPEGSISRETNSNPSDSKESHEKWMWTTPIAMWESGPLTEKGSLSCSILFPTDLTTLPDGMMVRHAPLEKLQAESPSDTPPSPVSSPQPEFPPPAKTSSSHGRVVVLLNVDKSGVVKRWKFVTVEPVGAGFAREVANVITQWKFEPARMKNEPVDTWVAIPFNFKFK